MTIKPLERTLTTTLLAGALLTASAQGTPPQEPVGGVASPSSDAGTPGLWTAVAKGDLEALQQHLAGGVDVNAPLVRPGVPGSGATPLHLAMVSGQLEAARLLLKSGANLEARAADDYRGTPLHWAAFVGRLDAVEFLIEAGANVNAGDAQGNTPLVAALNETVPSDHRPAIVTLLRSKGGTPKPPEPPVAETPYRGAYFMNGEIHVNTYGTPEGEPLTTGHWDFKPSWSRTGDMLVFFRRLKNDPVTVNWLTAICIINVNGTGFRQLTDGTHTDFNQTWTRDGTNTPIWNRKNPEKGSFHVMASKVGAKPGEESALTDKHYHTWAYTCLMDGRILVQSAHPTQGWGYFLMTPGRSPEEARFERIECALASRGLLDRVSLSPSETRVCFEYQRGYDYKDPGRTLYLADFDATKPAITNPKAFANEAGANRWFAYPRWTKDEAAIVYHASPSLYLYTLKDGSTRKVSTNPQGDYRYPHTEAAPK